MSGSRASGTGTQSPRPERRGRAVLAVGVMSVLLVLVSSVLGIG